MTFFRPSSLLRKALLADAMVSGATGLVMALGAGLLVRLFGLPEPLLRYAGLFLLPYAVFVAVLGTRQDLTRPRLFLVTVWAVIFGNAAWTAGSIALLFTAWVGPTVLGLAFMVAQAAVVALFAELQYVGLRRSLAA